MSFNEPEALEIVTNDKSRRFNVCDIEKIYVTYTYCFFCKKYCLKIKTKDGISFKININKKDKSKIKRQVCFLRILMNWKKKINQHHLEFT